MIPLGDVTRKSRRFPIVTILIIAANFVVFVMELQNGDAFIQRWSLVPAHVVAGRDLITVLTAMFMHASWIHILGNMLFFWVFGPPIEDAMGSGRFLAFYLLAGVAATIAQVAIAPTSQVPNLGASGAIAGVMGAFLVTYPRDRIRTLLILGIFIDIEFIPAIILVGIWIAIQFVSEIGALAQVQMGGVAYMAHLGGFAFGLIANRFFEVNRER